MIRSLPYYLPVLALAAAGICQAGNLAFNGFETGTGDWSFTASGQTGDANGSITQTASGTGPLDLTAYDGNFYGTVHGNTNGYSTGYANGGSSFFGFDTSIPPHPGSPFSQSIAVYINVNTPAPSIAGTPAFWIDTSPSSSSPSDAGSGGIGYGGEHNFRLTYTGTTVTVTADGSTPLATITTSGWYVFQDIYAKGATPTSLSTDTLSIFDAHGNQVGVSGFLLDNADSDPLESQAVAHQVNPVSDRNFPDTSKGFDPSKHFVIEVHSALPRAVFIGHKIKWKHSNLLCSQSAAHRPHLQQALTQESGSSQQHD